MVTVSGSGSRWTSNLLTIGGLGDFAIAGNGGSGSLIINSGGRVDSTSANVAEGNGASGSVTVTGAGSQWNNSGELTVGAGAGASGYISSGGLAVSDGGQVSTTTNGYIGRSTEGGGFVTVSGVGSSLNIGGTLNVGDQGSGVLSISDAATVIVDGGTGIVNVGRVGTASGILSIGGEFGQNAAAPGSLQAGSVQFGTRLRHPQLQSHQFELYLRARDNRWRRDFSRRGLDDAVGKFDGVHRRRQRDRRHAVG